MKVHCLRDWSRGCVLSLGLLFSVLSTQADEPNAGQRLGPARSDPLRPDSSPADSNSDGGTARGQLADSNSAPPAPQSPPAQQNVNHQRFDVADDLIERLPPTGLFHDAALARFRLLGGKVLLDPVRYRKGSEEFSNEAFTEVLHVSAADGIPAVLYRYESPQQTMQLMVQHGGGLQFESLLKESGEVVRMQQSVGGQIQWHRQMQPAGREVQTVYVQGTTILHIVGQDPVGWQQHADWLYGRVLAGRSLLDLAEQTKAYLRNHVGHLSGVTSEHIDALTDQLGSTRLSERRAARKKLADLGTVVIPMLRRIVERSDLDAEQARSLQTLIDRSPRHDDDTVASLAFLLSADRMHWQIMAAELSTHEWFAANDHMQRCGLESLHR